MRINLNYFQSITFAVTDRDTCTDKPCTTLCPINYRVVIVVLDMSSTLCFADANYVSFRAKIKAVTIKETECERNDNM